MNATENYQGWTNYETWAVNLWIGNDEGEQGFWQAAAQTAYDDAAPTSYLTRLEAAQISLADGLKENVEEFAPEVEGLYADLLNAAISEVNWSEIAASLLENVDQDEAGEE